MQGTQIFQAGDQVTARVYTRDEETGQRVKNIRQGTVAGTHAHKLVVLFDGDSEAHGALFRRVRMASDGTPASIARVTLEQTARQLQAKGGNGNTDAASIVRDAATLASVGTDPAGESDASETALSEALASYVAAHPVFTYPADSESDSETEDSESDALEDSEV